MLGILMAITVVLLVYAIATGGSDAAISLNLVWGYFLFVFAVAAALFCAIFGMIQNPAGIKGTILSLALIIIVLLRCRPHGEHRRSPDQWFLRPR